MSDFTAKDVQALRQATGAGMMDAKRALTETGGDIDKAKDLLREQGLADASKRADRAQTEGAIVMPLPPIKRLPPTRVFVMNIPCFVMRVYQIEPCPKLGNIDTPCPLDTFRTP